MFESQKRAFRLGFCHSEQIEIASPLRPQSKVVFSHRASHKNTLRPKVGNPIRKPKVGVSLRASVILQSRTCHWSSEIGVSIFLGAPGSCRSAQQTTPLIFRKWRFHLPGRSRLLSFCQVEHAAGLQKVAFPFFWALEAPVVLHSRPCH